jgi:hypothetical protein
MSSDAPRPDWGLSSWLEAERTGRLDEAEAVFAALLAEHAAPLSPPEDFADRVVARAVAAYRPAAAWFGIPVRALIALSMMLMGLPLALFTGVSLFDLLTGPGTRLAPVAVRAFAALRSGFSALGAAWDIGAVVAQALLTALSTGPGPLILLLNLLLATAGYLGLRRLLAPPKECW